MIDNPLRVAKIELRLGRDALAPRRLLEATLGARFFTTSPYEALLP